MSVPFGSIVKKINVEQLDLDLGFVCPPPPVNFHDDEPELIAIEEKKPESVSTENNLSHNNLEECESRFKKTNDKFPNSEPCVGSEVTCALDFSLICNLAPILTSFNQLPMYSITQFTLKNNFLDNAPKSLVSFCFDKIGMSSSISSLSIINNSFDKIAPDCLDLMSKPLISSQVKSLSLHSNNLGKLSMDGIQAFFRNIAMCPTITHLDLRDNGFQNSIGNCLKLLLAYCLNTSIISIEYTPSEFSQKFIDSMNKVLGINLSKLKGNAISSSVISSSNNATANPIASNQAINNGVLFQYPNSNNNNVPILPPPPQHIAANSLEVNNKSRI